MKEKLRDILKKYRFAALVALVGVVLMLLPGKKDSMPDAETAEGETFSLEETERRMAEVLGAMDGVGFCATEQDSGAVRVHWVQVGRQRIPLDATV